MRTLTRMFSKALFAFVLMTAISMNTATGNQNSRFIVAVQEGNIELVKWLTEQGADVNDKDEHGEPALVIAARNGQIEIAEFLVKSGKRILTPNMTITEQRYISPHVAAISKS